MNNYIIIFLILIIVAAILIKISYNDQLYLESFGPKRSDIIDVGSGSSTYYKWGLSDTHDDNIVVKRRRNRKERCKPKKDLCTVVCPKKDKCNNRKICENCDITLNKDIDKYVLKSSVPPRTDMSKYATKNMMCPSLDTSKYILKSEIPVCPKIDLSKYILKSKIPPCPDCPKCPKCPICPTCPKMKDIREHPDYEKTCIFRYNITKHPDFIKKCKKTLDILDKTDYKRKRRKQRKKFNCDINNASSYSIGNGMRADLQSCSPYKFPKKK